jgi:hypothetical protein
MRLDYVVRIVWLLATVGELVTGFGANLERSSVVDLILGSADTTALARIVEQQENLIRFRIPISLAAGRYRIVLVVSRRWGSELIDQETFIDVLEGEQNS